MIGFTSTDAPWSSLLLSDPREGSSAAPWLSAFAHWNEGISKWECDLSSANPPFQSPHANSIEKENAALSPYII